MPSYGALSGDLYSMSSGHKATDNPSYITLIKPAGTMRDEDLEQGRMGLQGLQPQEEGQKPGIGDSPSQRKGDPQAQDAATAAAPSPESIDGAVAYIADMRRIWLGDTDMTPAEQNRFRDFVSASSDPYDAAGRYVASLGISRKMGIPQQAAYESLDSLSRYLVGTDYTPRDSSIADKWNASWMQVELAELQEKWGKEVMRNGLGSPKAKELDVRIQELMTEQEAAIGGIPTGFWDKFSGDVIGSAGYTIDIASRSIINSLVTSWVLNGMVSSAGFALAGGAGGGIALGTATAIAGSAAIAQGAFASFARSKELARGSTFYELMHMVDENGNPLPSDASTAWALADVKSSIVGFTESMFDGIVSRLGTSFAANAARRMGIPGLSVKLLTDKGLSGTAARVAYGVSDWLAGGLNEGFIQEGTEALTDSFVTALYENAIGTDPDLDIRQLAHDYFEASLTGTLVGLVYGGASIPGAMTRYNSLSFDLRRIADATPSREAYFEKTYDMKPEGVSQEDFDEAREIIYGESREYQAGRSQMPGGVMISPELAQEEMYSTVDPDTGEETASALPDGSVYRTPDTERLYTEARDENGRRYVYAGNPDTGAVYGYAEVSTDGDTLSVGSVRVRPGYEQIRAELVQDAISSQRTGESAISWEPKTVGLQTVRDILVQNNPRGAEAGLDYGADFSLGQDHDIQQTASDIRRVIPNLSQPASIVAARYYSIADRDSQLTSINKGQFIRPLSDAGLSDENLAQMYRGAADAAKAVIYAGQNADFSTFWHEMFHVNAYQRPSDARNLSNAVSSALRDDASRENLRKFIEESKEIWGDGFDIDSTMDSLASIAADADASSWTRGQFEDLARLAEAYASAGNSTRTTLPEAIRNILRKIGEYMRKVYQTIAHTVPLPKEIMDAYDRLMTGEGGASKAPTAQQGIQNSSKNAIRMPIKENTYEAAIELATEAHPQFVSDIENIRKLVGADESDVSIRPALKSRQRSDEKVFGDYGGDYGQNLDYDGAMIKFGNLADAENAWNKVKESYGDRIVKDKHLITPLGYEDYKVNIRMDNGFIAEIQFLDRDYFFIKEGIGHDLYEISRTITEFRHHGIEGFNALQEAVDTWSALEYGLAKAYASDRSAYESSEARLNAVSSSIRQALSSALSRYQVSSESVNALSAMDLPSSEGISLETGEEVAASILNGISLISTYLKDSGIMPSTQSISERADRGNLMFQDSHAPDTSDLSLKQNSQRDEAQRTDDAYMEGEPVDLDDFYDGYDSSFDGIDSAEDAEALSRIYSEWEVEAADADEVDASLIDSDSVPYWDDDSVNVMPDGSIAATEAEYERAVNDDLIPYLEAEAGDEQDRGNAPAGREASPETGESTPSRLGIDPDDAGNPEMSWDEFVERNRPDAEFTGTDDEKDAQFARLIQDDDALLRYLGIIGDALFLNTRYVNDEYYFDDQIQRERIKARAFDTITNTSVRNASRMALTPGATPVSVGRLARVRSEMAANARFYRNILSFMLKDEAMRPDDLIAEPKGLDIPSRSSLDAMPIDELRTLARKAGDEDIVRRIENGTLKVSGDIDEERAAAVDADLKSLAGRIREQQRSMQASEAAISRLEADLDAIGKGIASRDSSIESAISSLRRIMDTATGDISRLGGEAGAGASFTPEMRAVMDELSWLSDARINEYISAATKGKHGKYEFPRAQQDGRSGYLDALRSFYPDEFDRDGISDGRLAGIRNLVTDSGFEKVMDVIRERRAELNAQLRDLAVGYLEKLSADARRKVGRLSGNIAETIRKVDSLQASLDRQTELKERAQRRSSARLSSINRYAQRLEDAKKQLEEQKRLNEEYSAELAKLRQQVQENQDSQAYEAYVGWWNGQLEKQRREFQVAWTKAKEQRKAQDAIHDLRARYEASISELKAEQREKRQQERLYRAIREEKLKLGRVISRPVNLNTTDYETSARAIMAIQAIVDPHFRREWVHDLENNIEGNAGGGTMSIPDAIAYLRNLSEDDRNSILSVLSPDLVARLTGTRNPLNDWSVEQLRQLAQQVEELRRRGREVLSAKKAFERGERERIQKAILESVRRAGAEAGRDGDDYLPGTKERLAASQGLYANLRTAQYTTMRMQELAQLLDGGLGRRGEAYHLLVDEKRYHQSREWRAVDSRLAKVDPLLTKEALDRLFSTISIPVDGTSQTFTMNGLAYIYLSQFDEDTKLAVMGTLLTDREKGTRMNRGHFDEDGNIIFDYMSPETIVDDKVLMEVAKTRYNTILLDARRELENAGLMPLVEAIRDDLEDPENFRRLNSASIEAFNTPLKKVEHYLPIKRTDLRGESFMDDMADSLFNLNTGDYSEQVRKGMTIERQEISLRHQRPVNLNLLDVWTTAVRDQEHLIEYAQYAKKLRGIFGNSASELISAIDKTYSPALMAEIQDYINEVINPYKGRPRTNTDRTIRNLRGRVASAYLGWKLPGVVLQFCTSAWPFLQEMGAGTLLNGYLKLAANLKANLDFIYSKSPMMKHRTMNSIIEEAMERKGNPNSTKASRAVDRFNEVGQLGLTWVDKVLVAGGWLGAYDKSLQESLDAGMDTALAEQTAVKAADDAVLRVQPAGDRTELPSLYRTSSEMMKIFLQFQSSLSVIWNNLIWDNIGYARNKEYGKVIGSIVAYGMAGLTLGLIADGFDDDDDAADRAKKVSYWLLTQGVESTPVFGSDISMILQRAITGEREFYGNGMDAFPGITKMLSGVESMVASDRPFLDGLKKFAEGIGIFAGFPTSGFKNLIRTAQEGPGALLGR